MKKQFLYISLIACQAMVAMEQPRAFVVKALRSPDMPSAAVPQVPSKYSLDQALLEEREKRDRERKRLEPVEFAAQLAAKLAPVAAARESEKNS